MFRLIFVHFRPCLINSIDTYSSSNFYVLEQYENGSNMIVSILFRAMTDFYEDHGFLPPVLFLNVDNCGRENKVPVN